MRRVALLALMSVGLCLAPLPALGREIIGTDASDTLIGTANRDVIRGLAGLDIIEGRRQADSLFGGPGNDRVRGNAGGDAIRGNAGNDTLRGGYGVDSLRGGRGDDTLHVDGDGPGDIARCGAGQDIVYFDKGDLIGGRRCEAFVLPPFPV
jgi:Ca2+-binding RTX toxin-like protein